MKTKLWLFLTFCLILPLVLQPNAAQAGTRMTVTAPQDVQITYGFIADSVDPQRFTAVLYPNVSAENSMISTATFTFLLPAGTVTTPSIADAPSTGSFESINGVWNVQKLTASLYASVGFNAADLAGQDLYQVVLAPGSAELAMTEGQPVPLFSFNIAGGCSDGALEILTNDSPLQKTMLDTLGANFNNQIAMSVNGLPVVNQYVGNEAGAASLVCPGGQENNIRYFLPFVNR